MKVFLDTNILIDLGEHRENALYAEGILNLGESGAIHLCASYLSYANMGYIWRDKNREERYELIRDLCEGIDILPMDATQLYAGLNRIVKDYEDMLQYQCAKAGGCDVIITNNTKDYREFCDIPFMSSRDFLISFLRQQ